VPAAGGATQRGRALSGARWTRGDPIVVFGDDWGRFVSTMQHLFRHLSLTHPVVWVNAIGHRPPDLSLADLRRAWGKVRAMARPRPAPPVHGYAEGGQPMSIIEPRGVLPWHQVGAIHWWNTELLVRMIRRRLAALGLTRPPVLVTGTPPSAGVVGRIGEAASVYFCMDDFLNFPGVSAKMIAPLERKLLGRVDALVATAASLMVSKRPASGIVHHLPQGVNFDHFSRPRPEPEELRVIPRPRIGFAGTVGGLCDLGLVRRIADTYPAASVVLVGPIWADDATMAMVQAAPNVHVLGMRPYAELPAYVQSFDVGLIPYVLNDWTKAVDSLKLLEYLAAGLAVVTSAMPEAAKYADQVRMTGDNDAFVAAVGAALRDSAPEARARRQAFASGHTWQHRAERLLTIIEELVARGG
jgi:hypothetical protein